MVRNRTIQPPAWAMAEERLEARGRPEEAPARPAPPAPARRTRERPAALLREPGALRRAMILREILGPPLALRDEAGQ